MDPYSPPLSQPQASQSAPTPVAPPVTPGWKTSEFWVTMLSILGSTALAVSKPNTGLAIGGVAATTAAYSLSRAYTKGNAPTP